MKKNQPQPLKWVTICSIFLFLLIVLISFKAKQLEEEQSYAEENNAETEKSNTVINPPKATEALKTAWDMIPGIENSSLKEELTGDAIIIKKPSVKTPITLEDFAVDRQIVITMSGLEDTSFKEEIYRVREKEENFYNKKIPTPSPTPTPTPIPSVTKIPEQTKELQEGLVESKPDNIIKEKREDPIESIITTWFEQEDGLFSVKFELHLDKTYVYEVKEDNLYYYILLKRPKDVYSKIVVVDAGHGLRDSGTYSAGYEYLEKDMNLSMLLYLKEFLDEEEDIKVYYTRTTDRRLTLNQRVNLANDLEADLFLSIHCNSNESNKLSGTEVLFNEKQDNLETFHSRQFAQICLEEVVASLGLKNRGLVPRSSNVHIIGAANMPVALIEVGFMTNASDLAVLKSESKKKLAAEGMYHAILCALEIIEEEQR